MKKNIMTVRMAMKTATSRKLTVVVIKTKINPMISFMMRKTKKLGRRIDERLVRIPLRCSHWRGYF